jgi:hypothetical protein
MSSRQGVQMRRRARLDGWRVNPGLSTWSKAQCFHSSAASFPQLAKSFLTCRAKSLILIRDQDRPNGAQLFGLVDS